MILERRPLQPARRSEKVFSKLPEYQGSETSRTEGSPAYSIIMWTFFMFSGLNRREISLRFDESMMTTRSKREASASSIRCA